MEPSSCTIARIGVFEDGPTQASCIGDKMDGAARDPIIPLRPDEHLAVVAETEQATVALTDQRVVVSAEGRTTMDVPVEHIRRVELDIEQGRPATLILVPSDPCWAPQVLAVPDEEVPQVLRALSIILERLRAAG